MKQFLTILAALVFMVTLAATALAYDKGDRIIGQWEDGFWYPGTVVEVKDKVLTVEFDAGEKKDINVEQIAQIDWASGVKLECKWPYDEKNYPGTLVERNGEKVRIVFDDGDKANLTVGKCRQSKASRSGTK